MKKRTITYVFGAILTTGLLFSACKKEEGTSQLKVRMVDAPANLQQVNVEVTGVEIHTASQGWVSLPANPGVYDLLTLQDSVSAVLVNGGSFPSGDVSQMRLILGSNNYIVADSIIYPLATPSAQQSGLKININYHFDPNETYELLLDFDAEKSIVTQGNGDYSLKPVIKILSIITL